MGNIKCKGPEAGWYKEAPEAGADELSGEGRMGHGCRSNHS